MSKLVIEWPHFEKDEQTCLRCAETGEEISSLVAETAALCADQGVEISFRETKLGEGEMAKSNSILLNGTPIEEVLAGARAAENHCRSCSELTGRETYCRTMEYEGETYRAIPGSLVRKAACAVADCCPG